MSEKYFQPHIDRVLNMDKVSEDALSSIRWALMRSPVDAHELKGKLQAHTAQLISDWQQLEEEFDECALSALVSGQTIDDILVPGGAITRLQARGTDLLHTYGILFSTESAFSEPDAAQLRYFLQTTGLAGVWRLLTIVKLLSNLPTGNLAYATSNLQAKLGRLKMSLHLYPGHYIEQLATSIPES